MNYFMMQYTKSDYFFFIFFLPLFAAKFLDITAENYILMGLGVVSALFITIYLIQQRYTSSYIRLFTPLLLFTSVLVLTSGKQAAFFSVLMLMGMRKVDLDNKIFKVCFAVGIPFFLLAIYLSHGEEAERFINGEWVTITKRSNIYFVGYSVLAVLYILKHRYNLKKKQILLVFITSIYMAYWCGSRTGLLVMILLISLVCLLKRDIVRKRFLIRWLCVYSPLYCMVISLCSAILYNNSPLLKVLDMVVQGRIYQNSIFYERYGISLFGNHIFEGRDASGSYWNLDCAYMDFLICEGLLFAILWIVATIAVIKYYYSKGRMVEVSILVMYAFYGLSETFLPNCFMNISLFLYGEYIYSHRIRSVNYLSPNHKI